MAKWHRKEDLTEAGTDLVSAALARKFTEEATADAAIQVIGSLNDFREADAGPGPFASAAPVTSEEEAVALAQELEGGEGFGAAAEGMAGLSPEWRARLLSLAKYVLTLWLGL